jgi:arylsulfatase A-like enzyme
LRYSHAVTGWRARVTTKLLGERPRSILFFLVPTALAVTMDVLLRGRSLSVFPPKEWLNYFGSSLASAGFWGGPLWLASRLFFARGAAGRAALGAFAALFVGPLAFFAYGGQALYFRVFNAYMARDTVRLGIALRGTLGAWLASWGASIVIMALAGLVVAAFILYCARRGAAGVRASWPLLPALAFAGASYCFWIDFVESRSLQAAPPDTCFIHGVMHAVHDGVTGKGWARRGISLRQPAPLPPLSVPAHRPNIVFVITESVRADALCSDPRACQARFLDDAAPDRVPLGRLTVQSSGTFTSCVLFWTGLGPEADFRTMHKTPVLWELARAAGYRTAYIGSQNLRYDDFGAFLERAGIDELVSASELGDAADPHIGAPDENATAKVLDFVKRVPAGQPYFAVLHLSNTHWPYRIDPALQPFAPHSESPFSPVGELLNHYKNSVAMQERTIASFVRALRATPGWGDTAVLFVSDHGEEFREHGGLYHLTNLFDEQLRVPGWLLAGPRAVDDAQRAALATFGARRTFSQDIHATLLDLLGALDARGSLPSADELAGRSLLRAAPAAEPMATMSTASGVWGEPDDPKYGVMQAELLAVRSAKTGWLCYDAAREPRQQRTADIALCAPLMAKGERRFAGAWP